MRGGLRRRCLMAALGLAAALGTPLSCARESSSAPSTSSLAASLSERTGISSDQATCAARRLERVLSDEDRRTVERDGLEGLSSARWTPYLQALAACVLVEGT